MNPLHTPLIVVAAKHDVFIYDADLKMIARCADLREAHEVAVRCNAYDELIKAMRLALNSFTIPDEGEPTQ